MNELANLEAEACAQAISAVIHDKAERQRLFSEFFAAHPDLKKWEGHAIGNRAIFLAKQKELASV